MGESIL